MSSDDPYGPPDPPAPTPPPGPQARQPPWGPPAGQTGGHPPGMPSAPQPPGGPPAWAPPPGPPAWPPSQPVYIQQTTNGKAVAALVLGILWIYWIGSILALVFGLLARKEIAASGGVQGGQGMATAGVVLGCVGMGTLTLLVLFGFLAAVAGY